ncbi:MAG: hypothetical protein ABIQ56_03780 [Chitinophagaceae bacterium]
MKKFAFLFMALVVCDNLRAQNNVGIGTNSPTQKLDVLGNLKVSGAMMPGDNAGLAGQVLTSSGPGVSPTWKNLAYSEGGRFYIVPTNNTRTGSSFTGRGNWNLDGASNQTSQEDSLDFGSTNETGSDFTISNPGLTGNFITVNRTGLYHFEGTIRYFVTSAISVILLSRSTLDFVANQPSATDLNFLLLEDPMDKTAGSETSSSTNQYNYTAKFSLNIHLQAGTTCTFKTGFNLLRFPGGADIIGMGVSSGGYISGHFISE